MSNEKTIEYYLRTHPEQKKYVIDAYVSELIENGYKLGRLFAADKLHLGITTEAEVQIPPCKKLAIAEVFTITFGILPLDIQCEIMTKVNNHRAELIHTVLVLLSTKHLANKVYGEWKLFTPGIERLWGIEVQPTEIDKFVDEFQIKFKVATIETTATKLIQELANVQ